MAVTIVCWCLLLLLPTIVHPKREIRGQTYWRQESYEYLQKVLKIKDNTKIAKNVVIMIGDGMGIETVTAIRIYKGELEKEPGYEVDLNFQKFPNVALAKTANTNEMVADSAASAVAILNGVRTRFGVLNVDDTVVRENCSTHTVEAEFSPILVWMRKAGKSTGVVTNTRVTHASPGAAYAHTVQRNWEGINEIPAENIGDHCRSKDTAAQLVEKARDIEVFFGGGRRYFLPNTTTDPEDGKAGRRTDGRNLIEEWKQHMLDEKLEATYVHDKETFDKINIAKSDRVLGIFEPSHMKYEEDRKLKKDEPSLTEMTEKAIRLLKRNRKGFFLFVEGGRIDHGHHASKAKYAITEGLEFERAVQKVIDLTDSDETLLIVTADHPHAFSIAGYPDIETPLFGINTDEVSDIDQMPYSNIVYGNGPGFDWEKKYAKGRQNLTGVDTQDINYIPQSAVPMKEETHSAGEVAVYAQGPWSHLFRGVHWLHYISQVMKYASCVERYADEPRCTNPSDGNGGSTDGSNSSRISTILLYLTLLISLFRIAY